MKFGIYTTFYNCERFIDKIFTSIESLNYDNFGNLIFDKNRINAGLRVDNLFKINDSFNFNSTINQTALFQS